MLISYCNYLGKHKLMNRLQVAMLNMVKQTIFFILFLQSEKYTVQKLNMVC